MINYNSKFNKIIDTIMDTENYTTKKYIKRKRNQELYNMINKAESQTIYIIQSYITLCYIYLIINVITKCINGKLYNHATLRANFNITNLEQKIKRLKPSKHYIRNNILSTKLHIKPTKVYEIKTIVDSKEPKHKFKFKFKSQIFTETICHNKRHYTRNYQLKWLFYLFYIILNNNYSPQISTNKRAYLKGTTSFTTSTMSCTTIFKIPTILSYYLKTSKDKIKKRKKRFC